MAWDTVDWGHVTDTDVEWTAKHEAALEQLILLIKSGKTPKEANSLLALLGLDRELIITIDHRYQEMVAQSFQPRTGYMLERSGWQPWYAGTQSGDKFWTTLKDQLLADPKWTNAVDSLDKTSHDVVARLGNPGVKSFSTRGLVLGYVQSGKTANFTATIAKAADAGYRLFIVLSGVHNALRRQTQLRLEKQIIDLNPVNWVSLTSEHADFGNPVQALPLLAGSQLKLLAVVKKNVSRLTNLVNWLATAQTHGALDACPILIIDDEADQASINTATDAELDESVIHAKLKELLNFPRVSYLGYTATPFANVLANPADENGIYPRDFIYALPKPPGYFGAEELFGKPALEEEESDSNSGHDLIRIVPEDEAKGYVVKSKQTYSPLVSPALADAIRWFVMATSARRVRSGETTHSSMLVHTTMRIQPQLDFVPVIKKFVKALAAEWTSGNVVAWKEQWEAELAAEPAELHALEPISFSEMSTSVNDVLTRLQVVADNSFSEERLIYSDEPATVIAVGGNTLSRGLTLEGLISSFFLRSTTMYDSALQMGRWFGYRPGYGDLPRVWTTASMAADFRFLAEIEESIRMDIERYSAEGLTPAELAVRLLLHPKMQITSRLKMQFAIPASASFSGARPQTIRFAFRDQEVQNANLKAARALVSSNAYLSAENTTATGSLVLRDVDVKSILAFLDSYVFDPSSEMGNRLLTDYIRTQVGFGMLAKWNVAVVALDNQQAGFEEVDLGFSRPFFPVNRSRVVQGEKSDWGESAYLKTITSSADFTIDLETTATGAKSILAARDGVGTPLMLIYPISKNSRPYTSETTKKGERRVELGACETLIGLAFSFPHAAPGSEPADMVHVEVNPPALPPTPHEADEVQYQDTEESLNMVSLDG